MKIIVAPAALADLERFAAFLAPKNPRAANRAARVLIAVQSLATLPERGRPSGIPNMRELIIRFGRSAYVLRYSYSASADEVAVHRIWHGCEMREKQCSSKRALGVHACSRANCYSRVITRNYSLQPNRESYLGSWPVRQNKCDPMESGISGPAPNG